jgi:sulfite exporter TauE/SafE
VDTDPAILTLIVAALGRCRAAVAADGGVIAALFATGLVGGVSHCAGMCGPFVLSQVGARLEAVPAARMHEFHRVAGAALVGYHLGRATTYCALGAAAAVAVGGLASLAGLRWLSAALLAGAALFFAGYALKRLAPALARRLAPARGSGDRVWSTAVARVARPLFAGPVGWRSYALGLALGFIPCGLLYGAIAAAAAPGDPVSGALGMAAFALGTVPSLFAVGLAGGFAAVRWRGLVTQVATGLLVVNAGVLSYMAWRLVT